MKLFFFFFAGKHRNLFQLVMQSFDEIFSMSKKQFRVFFPQNIWIFHRISHLRKMTNLELFEINVRNFISRIVFWYLIVIQHSSLKHLVQMLEKWMNELFLCSIILGTLFEKSNFCPKIQFWQIPNISRVFHPKKSTIFSGNQSWIFGQKMKISNSVKTRADNKKVK